MELLQLHKRLHQHIMRQLLGGGCVAQVGTCQRVHTWVEVLAAPL